MGQYHIVVNLDKRQYIDPHALGDGLKLMEFGRSADGVLTGLTLLLACSNGRGGGDFALPVRCSTKVASASEILGSWAGDRIAIVGDYAEDGDLTNSPIPAGHIYDLCVPGRTRAEAWKKWQAQVKGMREPSRFRGGQTYAEEYPENYLWRLDVKPEDLFTDVAPYLAALLEAGEGIRYTGNDGTWKDKVTAV